jgi:hypothetical protein
MKLRRWFILPVILILLAMACNIPQLGGDRQATQAAKDATAIAEMANATLLAQAANLTATAQAADAAAAPQNATLTAASLASGATTTAQSAGATATAQVLAMDATAISQAATATAQAQAVNATTVSQAATATALAIVPLPSNPPPPANPPPVSAPRLSFLPGATSATLDGVINKGAILDYLVGAQGGQTMLASVYSPNDNVYLGIMGVSDGVPLLYPAAGQVQFNGKLPITQDYLVTLVSPVERTNFTLQIIIPARIQFAPGSISATIPGNLQGGQTNYYLARAFAGQTMRVQILSPHNDIFLTIYGMDDGSPLVRSVMGLWEWSGVLPATQDYMIEAVSTGPSAGYTLVVTIQ